MKCFRRIARGLRSVGIVAAVAGTVLAGISVRPDPAVAGQGTGNPRLSVSTQTAAPDRVTTVTVTGTDYLVPPYAEGASVFGGVYVFFGWVSDPTSFGPSIRNSANNNGTINVTYAYPGDGGDANIRDDGSGVVRLVAFTGGGESGETTDYIMDREGNWSTTIRIYGSTFRTTNPATGVTRDYDCLQVQCGIFTIGAHGLASGTNERFIPINFAAPTTPTELAPTVSTAPPSTAAVTPSTSPSSLPSDANPGAGPSDDLGPGNDLGPSDEASPEDVAASEAATPTTIGELTMASAPTDASPNHAITATVLETRSTRSSVAQIALLVALIAAGIAGVIVLRRRGATEPAAPAVIPTPTHPTGAPYDLP